MYVAPAANAAASGLIHPANGLSDTSSAVQEPRYDDRGWRPELEHNLREIGHEPPK